MTAVNSGLFPGTAGVEKKGLWKKLTAVNFGIFKLAFVSSLSDSATKQERLHVKLSRSTIENAAGVALAMIGMASVSATGGVTGYAKAGAALLSAYNKLIKDTSSHGGEMSIVIAQVQSQLEADFDGWAEGGDIPAGAFAPADTAVAAVLPLLYPSPERLFACGRDNERFVALLLEDATERAAHDFSPGSDPQIAYNCAMLAAVFRGALKALDGDADFERKIGAWFQREVLASQNAQTAMLEELLRRTPDRSREIPEKTIIALAQRISLEVDNIDGAIAALDRVVEIVISDRDLAARGSNLGDDIDEVMRRLSVLTGEGKLDEASNAADEAFLQWQERQNEERAKGIKLLDAGVNQDILRRDAAAVAAKIATKFHIMDDTGSILFGALREEYFDWYHRGKHDGSSFDLEVSIRLAEKCLMFPVSALDRGAVLHDVGAAYTELGARMNHPQLLHAAIKYYRDALVERTRLIAPTDWAMTQNNLGVVLRILGEREGNWDMLEEAAGALRQSLEVRTRETEPIDWATTQMNLGNVLSLVGERKRDSELLAQSVEHYRDALSVLTADRTPDDWAGTHANLGAVLLNIGKADRSTASLGDALNACTKALPVLNRERLPLKWASLQNNIGSILCELGGLEDNFDLIEQGVAAYRFALLEQTRERSPLLWARTQSNFGGVLSMLGLHKSDQGLLQEAVQAINYAMTERTRERAPLDWARSQSNLAAVYLNLHELTGNSDYLEKSLFAVDSALKVFRTNEAHQFIGQTGALQTKILLAMLNRPSEASIVF